MEIYSMYLQNESIDDFCIDLSLKKDVNFDDILETIIDSNEECFDFENLEYTSNLEVDEMILSIAAIITQKKIVDFKYTITDTYKEQIIKYLEHLLENDHEINDIWEQETSWFSFVNNILENLK